MPDVLDQELAGLDHLDVPMIATPPWWQRVWAVTWPKLIALGVLLAGWQLVAWWSAGSSRALPGPVPVGRQLRADLATAELWTAVASTLGRALLGFSLALVIGGTVGMLVSRWPLLRAAIGSLITGLQTMPSIAWFPLALLFFSANQTAILFVVVLGAAPSIANGIITGVDSVPPLLRRLGTSMGAGTVALYRDVVMPAGMPAVMGGIKQGWAFSWRSLLAGELIVTMSVAASLGQRLQAARQAEDITALLATLSVILTIGILVDALVFGRLERRVLRRRGLA